ncbi:MAG: hypothetical protein GEV09_20610 [Pseudonocardiaceae bacterium]|nr:hypothetical protein [Pseudonocardiaceae bacterium]
MMNYSQALAHTLAARGARDAFGLMGSGNLRLINHLLHDHGVAFHSSRHEAGAVAAADGYARSTDRLGVALVTQGPGFTNALTSLVTARRAGTPLLLFMGDSSRVRQPRQPFARVQALPQSTVLAALDVPTVRPRPGTAAADLDRAIDTAIEQSMPVAVALPAEYESAPSPLPQQAPVRPRHDMPVAPEPDQIEAAARVLRAARRPVVLAGLGAVRAQAKEALQGVAEQLGALLCTSLRAAGLFAGHPHDVGISGGFAPRAVHAALAQADCVLAVGASLNEFTSDKGALFAEAEIIHCDADPTAFADQGPPALRITGDARCTAAALLERLRADGTSSSTSEHDPVVQHSLGVEGGDEFDDTSGAGVVDPRALCVELDALLPRERTLVVDGGHFSHFVVRHLSVSAPGQLHYMLDFGAVGGAMGAAIGAAIGRPDSATTLFIGDGGFFMTLGDLDLAVRERLPLLVVVMNDRGYGAETELLRHAGFDPQPAMFETPDLSAVAASLGCEAASITALEDLAKVADGVRAGLDGPLVLDCRLSRDVSSGLIGR